GGEEHPHLPRELELAAATPAEREVLLHLLLVLRCDRVVQVIPELPHRLRAGDRLRVGHVRLSLMRSPTSCAYAHISPLNRRRPRWRRARVVPSGASMRRAISLVANPSMYRSTRGIR